MLLDPFAMDEQRHESAWSVLSLLTLLLLSVAAVAWLGLRALLARLFIPLP
jgi:hypothetical protein